VKDMRDSFIIDAHVHVGSTYMMCYFTDRRFTASELIAVMDRCGVSKACVSGGGLPHEVKKMNEEVLKAVKAYPDRIIGFVRLQPWFDDVLDDLDFYIRDCGFKGIKLHPMQDMACLLIEPTYDAIFEKAAKYRVPILIHSGTVPWTMPGQFADLALMYPEVKIIMGHSCQNLTYQHLGASVKRAPNLILESSTFGGGIGSARTLGKDRAVYGSNWPAMSMRAALRYVEDAGLTDEERSDVLGMSMARILGINL